MFLGKSTPVCLFLSRPPSHPPMHMHLQGTLFNALAVGACVYGIGAAGILNVNWMPAAAILFGVITSAVDPVAVSEVVCVLTCVVSVHAMGPATSVHIW